MVCLEVRDMRDARDERTDGGTTTGASVRGASTCCNSELLDETDWTGLGGGAWVPVACSQSCTLECDDDCGDVGQRPNNNNDCVVNVSADVCTCIPEHTVAYWPVYAVADSSSANVGRDITCAPTLDGYTTWWAGIGPADVDIGVGLTCVGDGRTTPLDSGCPT